MGFRTDLAIENKEMYDEEKKGGEKEIPGVEVITETFKELAQITRIRILDERGSAAMAKPPGNYITIELPNVVDGPGEDKVIAGEALAQELKRLISVKEDFRALVVGLGNDKVTPDALGPNTASKIKVTRHYYLLSQSMEDQNLSCVSAFIPGVMGNTGIESAELIRSAAELARPDVIVAVDALAARNIDRMNTTIQISDTGIAPGAGTGNMRKELNEKTLGIKVIAIGVPTVIDARTLIIDGLSGMLKDPVEAERTISQSDLSMIVTSSEIDQIVKDFSDIIANGINITLHPGIYS